jgi:hypothetical protein
MNNSVQEIIGIAKKSQYLSAIDINKSGLFGGGIDRNLPNKIYTVRKSVEYMQGVDGQVEAARALGTVTITAIGNNGDTFEVLIDDPVLGSISLGTYTKVLDDTTTTILATNIADEMNNNTYGYSLTTSGNLIRIYAPIGYGNLINGGTRLSVSSTGITSTLSQFSGGAYADSGNSSLEKISNYLYWLCGRYALVAQGISGEGSIAPITAGIANVPNRLDFIVSTTSVIVTGQTTKTIANFIGYNIIFSRNGLVQSTTDTGGSYYSWNANTGLLTLINGEAQEGDQFLIIPNEI